MRAFQSRNKVEPVDGVAGNKTLQKLYSSSAVSATAAGTEFATLREGDNGDAVRTLQQRLKTLGYYTGSVDGDYGSGTVAAV